MITFDYECPTCGLKFTYLQKDWEATPAKCPGCGAEKPKRLISTFRTKSMVGPWDARHRRGLKFNKPAPTYPLYSEDDLK
jgi:putative FmdB family regulatory protein